MREKKYKVVAKAKEDTTAADLLAENCELSKIKIKKLMASGACWTKSAKSERIRKAKYKIAAGESIQLYVDPNIQEFDMSQVQCIHQTHHYGVYYKPVGLLSQGTRYGDEYTILRHVQKEIGSVPFLIHRLDRETAGLMLIAYTKKGARNFSQQIKDHKIQKGYLAEVKGHPKDSDRLVSTVDGKEAILEYKIIEKRKSTSLVDIKLITGRKHQIRIQFTELGHPIMGDPKYGQGNGNDTGLALIASKLVFDDPWRSGKLLELEVPKEKINL